MDYKPLSARERKLIEEIETRDLVVFSPFEASKILGVDKDTVYRVLSRLEHKEAIVRIERGKYIIRRFYSELDIYDIAPHVVEPSYMSLWSGLHYYGLTTQVPRVVFLMVTRARKGLELQGYELRYVKVKKKLFFGYKKVGRSVIAEPEKLLLDCLAFPHYTGGFGEIEKAARTAELDMNKMVDYAIRTGSGTICSRLGYLLETTEKKFDETRLLKHISRSYVLLDPTGSSTSLGLSKKWNVKINQET